MIAYRASFRQIDPRALLSRVRREQRHWHSGDPSEHERLRNWFIELGELESALADLRAPDRDEISDADRACRALVVLTARMLRDSWRGARTLVLAMQAVCHACDRLLKEDLPPRVRASTSEGYAYYAVYPEAYLDAARRLAENWPRGTHASVVGLRGIGTGLSAMAVAGLEGAGVATESWTVRPRGHPFHRVVRIGPVLGAEWQRRAATRWVLVDEGPGLSGSSLASVADDLVARGVAACDITLMPNWAPDPDRFAPPIAASWRRHAVVAAPADRARTDEARLAQDWSADAAADLSAGRWRDVLWPSLRPSPAASPAHERRKWLVTAAGSVRIVKFAGLGPYGARVLARARRAADAGFSPSVIAMRDGFVACPRLDGRPLRPGCESSAVVDRLSRYLAWIGSSATEEDEPRRLDPVLTMATCNAREALGRAAADVLARVLDRQRPMLEDGRAVRLDGRMFPHEWIETRAAVMKTDAAEHDDDHFFPGPLDLAWDVASTIIEFRCSRAARTSLVDEVARLTRDSSLALRVPLYIAIYLAFRAGYTAMAAASLGSAPDERRLRRAHDWYVRALARATRALDAKTNRRTSTRVYA